MQARSGGRAALKRADLPVRFRISCPKLKLSPAAFDFPFNLSFSGCHAIGGAQRWDSLRIKFPLEIGCHRSQRRRRFTSRRT